MSLSDEDIWLLEQIFICCKKCKIHYKDWIMASTSICPNCNHEN